ncbi:MAG: methionine adenosyltransferase [Thermoproteota archaeon]
MNTSIVVKELSQELMDERPFEVVERKGIGHPDTIADSVMDAIAIRLGKEYIKKTGHILHYNLDKSLLVAGETSPAFGGGRVIRPMLFIFGDRATFSFNGIDFDIPEIAINTAKEWIFRNLRFVDVERHVKYQVEIGRSATNLSDIFRRGKEFLGANDTSAAVGYAPESRLERLVYEFERHINSNEFKSEFPETGEDVKVMGVRTDDELSLTLAVAFVDKFINNEEGYFRIKGELHEALMGYLKEKYDFGRINLQVNTLDEIGRGVDGLYLTTLGTSAESGDSGQVGRGNRVNGVIALNRPAGSEAAAGKNPTSHVGKIYNTLAFKLAKRIVGEVDVVKEAYVWLVSQIGTPINEPTMVATYIIPDRSSEFSTISKKVKEVIEEGFSRDHLRALLDDLVEGRLSLC